MPLYRSFLRIMFLGYGLLADRPLALSDINDVDGIVSAALFKRRYPQGVVILAYPPEVKNSPILKRVKWEFVADLPCPGKVKIRADHHETNTPCAENEYYDPKAPASALLALKALELEGDEIAEQITKIAIETDTANIKTREALLLDAAVKGAGYLGKLYLAESLARKGLKVLDEDRVKAWIDRYLEVKRRTEELSEKIPVRDELLILFKKDLHLSYRYLSILLERRGANFTFIIVPKSYLTYRIYAGSTEKTPFDSAVIARRLGGGGHRYAAGASVKAFPRSRALATILSELKKFMGRDELSFIVVRDFNTIEEKTF